MNLKGSQNANLNRLFFPRAVGIIGASINPAGGGYFARCMSGKFRGDLYLFNPRLSGQVLFGQHVYGSILEIPDNKSIDYVILGVRAKNCPKLLEEIGQKGVPYVTVFASGFSEIGKEDLENQILEIASRYNFRIIGPNCIGVYNPAGRLFYGLNQCKKAGNFSGVLQSGGLAVNVASLAISYGCYVSKMISIGNAIDLTYPDFLEYFNQDKNTAIIGLYVENLKSIEIGRRLMETARKCNLNRKPVILWKSGYGEATKKAIISHTGGLAGNNKIWESVAKQTGSCLVRNSNELTALASAFKFVHLPSSRNIGLIGIGGGSTIEASDSLENYNLKLPELTEKTINKLSRFLPDINTNKTNPVDLGGKGTIPNIYYQTIITLDKDPNISAIVFVRDPERFSGLQDQVVKNLGESFQNYNLNKEFIRYINKIKKRSTKPLLCVMLKISEGVKEYKSRFIFKSKLINRGIPVFNSVEMAAKVLNHLNTYREFLQANGLYFK